jgi:hypothetical protein
MCTIIDTMKQKLGEKDIISEEMNSNKMNETNFSIIHLSYSRSTINTGQN